VHVTNRMYAGTWHVSRGCSWGKSPKIDKRKCSLRVLKINDYMTKWTLQYTT
jgi:hypothetical protein